jgi:hypothetical protein
MIGLGSNSAAFKYLDEFVSCPDWSQLHTDVCYGIARSHWNKRYVSSGIHDDFADKEITPYVRTLEHHLTDHALDKFNLLDNTDQRLKFVSAWGPIPHPFWLIYIRDNKRIEPTGIFNKSLAQDCDWTDNKKYFGSLIDFIEQLPFQQLGRIILFMTEANNATLPHYDGAHRFERPSDDFVWFTTKPSTKQIFVFDELTKKKHYPDPGKKLIWFNEMDFHGTDPVDHFSFSIRIDGQFRSDIKQRLLK